MNILIKILENENDANKTINNNEDLQKKITVEMTKTVLWKIITHWGGKIE